MHVRCKTPILPYMGKRGDGVMKMRLEIRRKYVLTFPPRAGPPRWKLTLDGLEAKTSGSVHREWSRSNAPPSGRLAEGIARSRLARGGRIRPLVQHTREDRAGQDHRYRQRQAAAAGDWLPEVSWNLCSLKRRRRTAGSTQPPYDLPVEQAHLWRMAAETPSISWNSGKGVSAV